MSEKIYVGNGKKKTFQNGGSIIDISLTLTGIKELFQKYGFTTDAGKQIIRLQLTERREPDRYGNTHSLTVNTWKPDGQKEDDIPF
jgi:hypothetical protein